MEDTIIVANVAKATRQELMDGYRALLKKYKDLHAKNAQEEHTAKESFNNAPQYSGETDIRASITNLRTNLNTVLSDIETMVCKKFVELKNFDETLTMQKTKLQELFEIEDGAGTLMAVLQARDEAKRMAESEKNELEQKRRRDEEEYAFTLNFQKRKDKENYEAEKRKLELELEAKRIEYEERQKALTAKEDEFSALRAQAEEFPKILKKEKQEIEAQTLILATKDREMALLLAGKETDAVKTVLEGRIQTLQSTMEEYKKLIVNLQEQLKSSQTQTQEVVLKSIESAAGAKTLEAVNKLALEQTRSTGGRN